MERIKKRLSAGFMILTLTVSGCSASTQEEPKNSGGSGKSSAMESEADADAGSRQDADKGYDLPISQSAKEGAEADCRKAMETIRAIYAEADKGDALNPMPDREVIFEMYEALQETGWPVTASGFHYIMGNDEKMEAFLENCLDGTEGELTLYRINAGGGLNRSHFLFDGTDMYVTDTAAAWNAENSPVISNHSLHRIKEWKYTEKGWFSYEYCLPEFPEVTEIANGNNLLRVRPMPEEYIKMAETYLLPIGYMGNNLLRSNWDGDHLEELDYNGLYEYLYVLKNQEAMAEEAYAGGIPKEEFENLITEYLPVSAKDLAGYAVFDAEKQTYGWEHLGPVTYAANRFSSSIPEVREIKDNPDGTLEVSIDAVCQAMGEDCVISHILTMRILEDGGVRYLGNRVLRDGLKQITEYQYRLPKDQR